MNRSLAIVLAPALLLSPAPNVWAQYPAATIRNKHLVATIALPDATNGYYRGTRFDWSGVVTSLKYRGHDFITPWSQISDPTVNDYEYRGDLIATGTNSTIVGLPEAFTSSERTAHGFEAAAVGGTFVKIGVGVLRKPDADRFNQFRHYEIVSGNQWEVKPRAASVSFSQTVRDSGSGYAYVYTKTLALTRGKPELTIEHRLRNTGSRAINGYVYEHNFMRWDNEPPGPDYSMHFNYDPTPAEPLGDTPLAFSGRSVSFTRALAGRESVRVLPMGFGSDPAHYDFRFENRKLGIGLRHTADQPLARVIIWGMRTVFAIEPFIDYAIRPGAEFRWKYTYQAYELGKR
jgi:hypothetical protein